MRMVPAVHRHLAIFDPTVVEAIIALGVVTVLFGAGWVAFKYYKRRLLASESQQRRNVDEMAHYEAMRDSGEITEAEYQAMRRAMLRKMSQDAQAGGAEPSDGGEPPDGPGGKPPADSC